MGYAKRLLEEQEEGGYTSPQDRFVCPACVTDPHLASALDEEADDNECSYCGAEQAADISVLLAAISEAIQAEYTDPVEELPYDGREGGYQGEQIDGSDLVLGLDEWTECGELLNDAAEAFSGASFCRRDYFGLNDYDALQFGWNAFSEQVKHRTRFLFLQEIGDEDGDPREIPPGRMLEALGRLFHEYRLFRELPAGSRLVRARVVKVGVRLSSAAELGTAPRERATSPNRMSPAGIPMFYGALDEETAVLETYEAGRAEPREVAIARFSNSRPLALLDLTELPGMPSVFDGANREHRNPIAFLQSFVRELARPVARDDRAHTEYVPTQVVTEFVRHRLRTPAGSAVDGILYQSSRAAASKALVIFAEPEHCGPRERRPLDPEVFLELEDVRHAQPEEFARLWASDVA